MGIDNAFLPANVNATITLVDTETAMEPKAYYSAVDGEDEALGIIGPQFNAPLFWILSSALIVWFFVIVALSFIHMVNQRKKEDLKRQL